MAFASYHSSFPNNLLQFSFHSPSPAPATHCLVIASSWLPSSSCLISLETSKIPLYPIAFKVSSRVKCLAGSSTEEDQWSETETLTNGGDAGGREDAKVRPVPTQSTALSSSSDFLSLGIREPVYEVFYFCLSLFSF